MLRAMYLLLLMGVCSCVERIAPQQVQPTSNDSVQAALLFVKDGYKVYRFYDGRSHYFVVPEGMVSETHSEMVGKIPVNYSDEIQTLREGNKRDAGKH